MDLQWLTRKIEEQLPNSVLETSLFGRTNTPTIWTSSSAVEKVASFLVQSPDLKFDWLENLVAIELEDSLVLSYFIKSQLTQKDVVLRVSLSQKSPRIASLLTIWKNARYFEKEIAEFFGVEFYGKKQKYWDKPILPEDVPGFPMRKDFKTP